MPINPFRAPANYDVPNFPAPAGRYDPSVFANIASIGDTIGQYRDQQQMADLAKGAVGPNGQLDINKFATSLALSGRNPAAMLREIETMRHQRESEGTAKTLAEAAMLSAKRKQWTYDPGDPNAGMPPGWRSAPDADGASSFVPDKNAPVTIAPRPAATPPIVKPQSALPGAGPNMASDLGGGGPAQAAFNPEEAAPYQVAGPPTPPPQQPPQNVPVVQAQPKPATADLPPDFEQRIAPLPAGRQEQIRSVGSYQTDPYKIEFATKQGQGNFFNMMRDLVPGWTPEGFARREEERKRAEALAETGPKAEQTKLGQERVTIEADAVKDAKAAVDLQPILDDITKSYENLINFRRFGTGKAGSGLATGTGPIAASAPVRLLENFAPGGTTTEEQLRQAYDRSLNALKAHATKVMNQGQGAVSNYERQMFAAVFPELTSGNPSGELATLRQMQKRNEQVANIGRETGLGKSTPGYLAERPGVERPPLGPDRYTIDAQTAKQYRQAPEMALNRAREFIKNGADPAIVKDILRKIDPTLPGKL